MPSTFEKLKDYCMGYLVKTKGIIYVDQLTKNKMTYEVLEAVHFMLNHGFYFKSEELIAIATPVIALLNGSNDKVVQGTVNIMRYFPSPDNDFVVKIKSKACDILL